MDLPGGHGGGCGLSWRAKEEKGGGRRGEEGRKKEEEEGRREGEEQIDEGRSMNGRKNSQKGLKKVFYKFHKIRMKILIWKTKKDISLKFEPLKIYLSLLKMKKFIIIM